MRKFSVENMHFYLSKVQSLLDGEENVGEWSHLVVTSDHLPSFLKM
jgi:hypothetical protein